MSCLKCNFAQAMKQVVIIGSGNVATSLAHGLVKHCHVAQIYSRQLAHARRLAQAVGCENVTDDLDQLVQDADAYIIAVRDDVIADVIATVPDNGALWVHTSGSKPIDLFAGHRARYGVLWPMQSFSRDLVVPLDDVHFFAEASDSMMSSLLGRCFHVMLSLLTVPGAAGCMSPRFSHAISPITCGRWPMRCSLGLACHLTR